MQRLALIVAALAVFTGIACADPPPNIVLIIADDLGYGDLACYGGSIATPHLDALASQGVLFTQAYVSGPVCAPARAGLMTGRHQARYGYETLTGAVQRQIDDDYGLDTREIILPQLLKEAGYATAAIGKWHLGYNEKYRPNNRGVDHFFGFLPGGHDYFVWDQPHLGPNGGPIFRNRQPAEGEGYITHAFTAEAIQFIRKPRQQPFFLYLAQFNVHSPFQVPDEYLPEGDASQRGKLIGMVRALDESVGQVLAALRDAGQLENTLIIFINDNGSPFAALNAPLRGPKGTLFEGGIRVPMIWRWPVKLRPGTMYDLPVSALDLMPTLVKLAGGSVPTDREIDGVDLMPFVTGQRPGRPHERLMWRFMDEKAIREVDLKLRLTREGDGELYDLAADPGEQQNLVAARPRAVERLRKQLAAWEQSMGASR